MENKTLCITISQNFVNYCLSNNLNPNQDHITVYDLVKMIFLARGYPALTSLLSIKFLVKANQISLA